MIKVITTLLATAALASAGQGHSHDDGSQCQSQCGVTDHAEHGEHKTHGFVPHFFSFDPVALPHGHVIATYSEDEYETEFSYALSDKATLHSKVAYDNNNPEGFTDVDLGLIYGIYQSDSLHVSTLTSLSLPTGSDDLTSNELASEVGLLAWKPVTDRVSLSGALVHEYGAKSHESVLSLNAGVAVIALEGKHSDGHTHTGQLALTAEMANEFDLKSSESSHDVILGAEYAVCSNADLRVAHVFGEDDDSWIFGVNLHF